jgi:hypothetical protein
LKLLSGDLFDLFVEALREEYLVPANWSGAVLGGVFLTGFFIDDVMLKVGKAQSTKLDR